VLLLLLLLWVCGHSRSMGVGVWLRLACQNHLKAPRGHCGPGLLLQQSRSAVGGGEGGMSKSAAWLRHLTALYSAVSTQRGPGLLLLLCGCVCAGIVPESRKAQLGTPEGAVLGCAGPGLLLLGGPSSHSLAHTYLTAL
jgi:hypothetical protein